MVWSDWVQPPDFVEVVGSGVGSLNEGNVTFGQFDPLTPDPGHDLSFLESAWIYAQQGLHGSADTSSHLITPDPLSPYTDIRGSGGAGSLVHTEAAFGTFFGGGCQAIVGYAGSWHNLTVYTEVFRTFGNKFDIGPLTLGPSDFGYPDTTPYEFENSWGTIQDARIVSADFYNSSDQPLWVAQNDYPAGVTDAPFIAYFQSFPFGYSGYPMFWGAAQRYGQRLALSIPINPVWIWPNPPPGEAALGSASFTMTSATANGLPWVLPDYVKAQQWMNLLVYTDVMCGDVPSFTTSGRLGNPAEPIGTKTQRLASCGLSLQLTVRPPRLRFDVEGVLIPGPVISGAQFFDPRDRS